MQDKGAGCEGAINCTKTKRWRKWIRTRTRYITMSQSAYSRYELPKSRHELHKA